MEWLLADAKNRFSEVVTKAITEGPQQVRRRNDKVVILSQADFNKLTGKEKSFKEFLLNRELSDLDLTRDQSTMRAVDL